MQQARTIHRSGRWLGAIAALVLGGGWAGPAAAQELSAEARKAMDTWLLKNCDVGHEKDHRLEADLKKLKVQLEPAFLKALEKGPDAKLVETVQARAAQLFAERQQLLKREEGLGLSKKDLAAAKKVTREQFIAREKEDFVLRYRSQAAAGLGIVGGDKAKEVLRKTAADKKSPLKTSAEQALKRLSQKE